MSRVTFNEITATAIEESFFGTGGGGEGGESVRSRDIDLNLVQAQETRRILDRLAGYTMSPLLWKKIAPGLTAGRVQSVGLALVVNRERERMRFRESEYWDLRADVCADGPAAGGVGMETPRPPNGESPPPPPENETCGGCFAAALHAVNGVRVASGRDFDGETGRIRSDLPGGSVLHLTRDGADGLLTSLAGEEVTSWLRDPTLADWTVVSVESKTRSMSPPVPFITSTLQQESNRRLGLSVGDSMRCAQILYEAGYISYMRTDSSQLSRDAIEAGGAAVREDFGGDFLSDVDPNERAAKSNKKKGKGKNAQEAHEAIRPSIQGGRFLGPSELLSHHKDASGGVALSDSVVSVYGLIFGRTTAALMKNQILNQTVVKIEAASGETVASFRATGSVVVFPGFTRAWGAAAAAAENSTSEEGGDARVLLPTLTEGQTLFCRGLDAVEHHTNPPPRYTEATFVKDLEALGVGRPSTYATIVQTLRQRAYVGTPTRSDDSGRAPAAGGGGRGNPGRAGGGRVHQRPPCRGGGGVHGVRTGTPLPVPHGLRGLRPARGALRIVRRPGLHLRHGGTARSDRVRGGRVRRRLPDCVPARVLRRGGRAGRSGRSDRPHRQRRRGAESQPPFPRRGGRRWRRRRIRSPPPGRTGT